MTEAGDPGRVALERDLYLRLLELGEVEDLPPFLEGALATIVELVQAQRGYLEIRASGSRPAFSIAHGLSDADIGGVRRAISSGIVAEAIATGRTISTASAAEDPRFSANESVMAGKIQAVLCAPIGDKIGVVYLQGKKAPGPFSETSRQIAELFARRLAPLADRALAREALAENADHTAELRERLALDGIAGTSRALAEVFKKIAVAAPVPMAVLVVGESGTGKTQIAQALHRSSPRARGPFVELNCAAIPENLFESELFGAEKGAHSTATQAKVGLVEAAKKGTLFLDEVGEMPLVVQSKLLTFLQSKRYYRLGGTTAIEADVRVVAATNANLDERVAEKRFREDLFYRLNVLEIRVPPLRERREDIPAIADTIAERVGAASGARVIPLSRAAKVALAESEWPGNVRQLGNAVERGWAVALSENAAAIEPSHLFPDRALSNDTPSGSITYEEAMRRYQARFVREALEQNAWNVSETARRIGVARSHLNDLIKAHGLARAKR
jgi:Nif-specific regulatory protein